MSERGISRLGLLFFCIFAFIVGFSAWNIIPFYYYHEEIQGLATFQARVATTTRDDKIRKVIIKEVKSLNIPIDSDDIQINRFADKIIIHFEYDEVFYVNIGSWGEYELWVFPFVVHAEANILKRR